MVLDLLVGFAVLVAASYIGTTMALRGFFDDSPLAETTASNADGDSPEAAGDD